MVSWSTGLCWSLGTIPSGNPPVGKTRGQGEPVPRSPISSQEKTPREFSAPRWRCPWGSLPGEARPRPAAGRGVTAARGRPGIAAACRLLRPAFLQLTPEELRRADDHTGRAVQSPRDGRRRLPWSTGYLGLFLGVGLLATSPSRTWLGSSFSRCEFHP
uniref:Uncharacterized protein n=1 Tax=Malurus cyaneus samueli TaxID=2593467 RepID=A0A8C5TE31_9PASS